MQYSKASSVGGNWADKTLLKNGQRAKIVTESVPTEEVYEGKPKTRNIVKVMFEGDKESKNVDLNRATVNGLIDSFGTDSTDWMEKYLTVHLEKMLVGGRRVTAMFLVPEGFEVAEDAGGFLVVSRIGVAPAEAADPLADQFTEDDIKPEDIPF